MPSPCASRGARASAGLRALRAEGYGSCTRQSPDGAGARGSYGRLMFRKIVVGYTGGEIRHIGVAYV
jgi:hypothetical protein